MKLKSFSYFALVNAGKSPGVAKKITNTVLAASNLGLNATSNIFPTNIHGVINFFISLIRTKSEIVMIRFSDLVFPAVFFAMLFLRMRGRKIIIDVPTPRAIGLKEFDSAIKIFPVRIARKLWTVVSGPWVLYPAHIIIQYADEGKWFCFGIKNKTVKLGNGILIADELPLIETSWPDATLKLIAVAQVSKWHGYDRVINALVEVNKLDLPYAVSFTIVGDGDELSNLKAIVRKHGLEEQVFFTGMLLGENLNSAFQNAHIGVASLGLYRIGLQDASVLKAREYVARGLSIICAGADPDFDDASEFRFEVENNDSVDGLIQLLSSFENKKLISPSVARSYAHKKLSLESKLSRVINTL